MKNPVHPGKIIREDIVKALGLSLTQAAEILGVRRSAFSTVAHSRAPISAEMALRLENAFGVRMEMLLRLQAAYDAAQVRMYASTINVKRYQRK